MRKSSTEHSAKYEKVTSPSLHIHFLIFRGVRPPEFKTPLFNDKAMTVCEMVRERATLITEIGEAHGKGSDVMG